MSKKWNSRIIGILAALSAVTLFAVGCQTAGVPESPQTSAGTRNTTGSEERSTEETVLEETSPEETTMEENEEEDWIDWETESRDPDHIHEYGEWTVTEDSTKYQPGSKERTCAVCGHVEVRRIAPGHHDYDPATGICREDGCQDGDPEFFTEEWFAEGVLLGHPDAKTAGELMLPGSVADEPVETIGISAFANCTNLKR